MFKSPMLAKDYDPSKLTYPRLGSVKLDGWRAVIHNSIVTTRSGKPVRNRYIQQLFGRVGLEGLDGELICGKWNTQETFNRTDAACKREEGEPDMAFYVFDRYDMPDIEYGDRLFFALEQVEKWRKTVPAEIASRVQLLAQCMITNDDDLDDFEAASLDDNFEGMMLRKPGSLYKFGRCSTTPGNDHLLKVKRFVDAEATILRFEERMINDNVAFKDELGRTKRTSHAENLRPSGMVGSAWVKSPQWEKEFKIGCGTLGHAGAADWFDNQDIYIGKQVVFKYLPHGVKDVPRHGVLKGLRSREDSETVA